MLAILQAAEFQGHHIELFEKFEENCGTVWIGDGKAVRLYVTVGESELDKTDITDKCCIKCGGGIMGDGYMDSDQCIGSYKKEEGSE